ncbi:cytochrome P450 704C1-like [Papaver somniferum]|uniref:cytochrome P450 704C1-like n=1 Tax=Papaver somniferum TaxID=3469 RepID=UPI000E6FECC7|nr:cytochrome P450 704C1-like [Papaver somniferum]
MNLMMDSSSFTTTGTVSVLALLLFTLIIFKISLFSGSTKKKYHPIAGTIFNQLLNFKRLHQYMTDLARKHKTYRLLSPFRSEVYTSDPANVEYILKTNFQNFGKGYHNYHILSDLLGDGIFAVDGEKWRHQRKVSSYEFSTKVLRDFSSAVFRKNAAKLARIISEDYAKSDRTIDAQDLLMKSTLDSIFKVGFGVELNSIAGSSEGTQFANAFNDSSAMTLWRYVDILWEIKRFLNVGFEAKLKKNIKIVDDFINKIISSKIEQGFKSADGSLSNKKEDILSRFLELNETDPRYLRDITLNFLVAGRDTTATTLSWFLYMLCKNPHVQDKAAKEVRKATDAKDNTPFDQYVESVTDDALDKMHYLHAALAETLRLYPAVPVDAKICFSDDTLPDGYSVRKGDMVAYQPYAMGRMKYIWGEDAEEFRPERWLDQDGYFRGESSFKFTAFQAGPRICLGKEFAYRQMKIFAAILLGCFVFKMKDENKPVNYRTMLNLHIDEGLYLQASHRSSIIN